MRGIKIMIGNKKFITVSLILYAAVIFLLSSLSFKDTGDSIQINDKLVHFVEYGIFGYFLMKYFTIVKEKEISRSSIFSLLYGGLYAVSDEIHQGFVGYFNTGIFGGIRNPDPFDFLADLAGIIIACMIFFALNKSFNFINNKTVQD